MPYRRAKSAGQDAPPTEKENDTIKTSYALFLKRNGITYWSLTTASTVSLQSSVIFKDYLPRLFAHETIGRGFAVSGVFTHLRP